MVAVAAISVAAPLFRLAAPTPAPVAAGVRLAFAAVLLAPWVVHAARSGQLSRRHGLAAAVGGLLYGVHFAAWVGSLERISVAASVSLVTATPLLLAGWSLITGRDRPKPALWGALALAAVGVGFIAGADLGLSRPDGVSLGSAASQRSALVGDALALLGAVAIAGYMLLVRRLGPQLPVLAFMGLATAVAAAALLSGAALVGLPLRPPHAQAWWALLVAAVVPQLVGHGLLTWSLRAATPTQVGVATVGEPVGASLLAWWIFAEVPGPWTLVGCACTSCAVLIAARLR